MAGGNGRAPAPSEYPPPGDPAAEFLGAPTDPEDERIEVGVAIVGGGQAGLACAIRLLQLLEDEPGLAESLGEVPVAVIEKGRTAGAHQLSGGVMVPSALQRLLPDRDDWPHWGEVKGEQVRFMLGAKRSVPLVPVPPPFRNHGNVVVSAAELTRWLAERAEEAGAYLLTETVASKLLLDEERRAVGVRTGDKGRDRGGEPKGNFEPGSDVLAQATVLADGTWGHLTGAAIKGLGLAAADPQVWALGVKEVWEVERPLQKVIHTLGWPLRPGAGHKEFGGSWIYPMQREGAPPQVSIGFVAGLDSTDSELSVHDLLQEFKTHPFVRRILAGGTRVAWGAKAIPEGGYWAMPRLTAPGLAICGDAGGMVDVPRLKGIHLAIESGRLAAEAIVAALKRRSTDFSAYERAVHAGEIGKDLRQSRNMKQPFAKGLVLGGAISNAMVVTKGRFPGGHWPTHRDADSPVSPRGAAQRYPKPDGQYTFDKLSSVYLTGNATRDDAPNHIRVQRRVPREVAQAWVSMCPAGVYEIPDDGQAGTGSGFVDVHLTPSNCVQCGAITAKGGRLTPPEGGDGPVYRVT